MIDTTNTTKMKEGTEIIVRLTTYKSRRHYGGRHVTPKQHIVKAKFIKEQPGYQPYIVELVEAAAGYNKGHRIAITKKDFNI